MKNDLIKKLCLGTVQFGFDYGIANKRGKPSRKEIFDILNYAHDAGIETLDTAHSYGDSEDLIGSFIAKSGKGFNIISKTPHFEVNAANVRDGLSETLRRLEQESIYGYLLHDFKDMHSVPGHKPGLWPEMESLRDAGTERIGFSLYKTEELRYLIENEIEFDIIQAPFNILDQRFKGYFNILKEMHTEVYARSVFLQGLFFERRDRIKRDFNSAWGHLNEIDRISKKYGIPVAALCLSFVMLNDSIDKVIIGVDSLKQLKENIGSLKYMDRANEMREELDLGSFSIEDEDIILPVNWGRKHKADAIIQARMGASRLPGKVLMEIAGKSVLEHVVDRVKRASGVDKVIIATSTKRADSKIAELADKIGVELYRGSEDDVLDRFYQAARSHRMEHIVRITADCPMIDPNVIDKAVKNYFEKGADLCTNGWERTFPDGQDVEVLSFKALQEAWSSARLKSEREHVTPYIINNPGLFKITHFKNRTDLSAKRWTLDEPEDLEFIKTVFEALYPGKPDFKMADVLRFLESNPGTEDVNRHHVINEGYRKSLSQDRMLGKKRRPR